MDRIENFGFKGMLVALLLGAITLGIGVPCELLFDMMAPFWIGFFVTIIVGIVSTTCMIDFTDHL